MIQSRTTRRFRDAYTELPAEIRRQTRQAYLLFRKNPNHPSLRFKKVDEESNTYSVRVSLGYRPAIDAARRIRRPFPGAPAGDRRMPGSGHRMGGASMRRPLIGTRRDRGQRYLLITIVAFAVTVMAVRCVDALLA